MFYDFLLLFPGFQCVNGIAKKGEEVKQKIKEKQTMENERQVGETVQAEVRTVKESLRAVAGFD